MTLPSNGLL